MAGEDVSVRFGAETSGVTAGGAEVKGTLSGIQAVVADLAALFKAMGAAALAGFDQVTAGAAEASTSLKEMRDVGEEVRSSFRGLGEALIGAFAVKEIADFTKSLADTAEETQHAATTFGLTASQVQQLRAEAAGLGVPFEAFTSAMQREDAALTRAREGSKQTGEAFKVLGVNIKEPVDNATLLQETIAALANVQDVPTRLGLAMQLFGKNIQNIAPLIGATKDQVDAISEATNKYGAVNADAQAAGLKLADAFDLQKIEMQGLGNTLTAELAPELTRLVTDITGLLESFRQWASQGTNLQDTVRNLAIAAGALASVLGAGALAAAVEGLAGLLSGVFLGAIQLATAGMVEFDIAADANPIGAVVLAVEGLAAAFFLLGGKAGDATAKIREQAAAESELDAQGAKLAQQTEDLAGKTKDELAAARATAVQTEGLARAHITAAQAALGQAEAELALDNELGGHAGGIRADARAKVQGYADALHDATAQLNAAIAAIAKIDATKPAASPPLLNLGGSGKGADQMEAYRTKLAQMEDDTRASTGAWLADLSQLDLNYWEGILAHAKLSSKDREEIAHTIATLQAKINGEGQTDQLDQDKARIEADKGNVAALTADWRKYVDDTVKSYGAGSKEVIKANADMAAALKEADKAVLEAKLKAIDEQAAAAKKAAADDLATAKAENAEQVADLKNRLELGEVSTAQYWAQLETLQKNGTAQEIASIQTGLAADEAAFSAKMQLSKASTAAQVADIIQLVAAEGAAADTIKKLYADLSKSLTTDGTDQLKQFQTQISPMVSNFTKGLMDMAQGTKSFAQEFAALGQSMLNSVLKVVDQMVTKWLAGELSKLATSKASAAVSVATQQAAATQGVLINAEANIKQITSDAAVAFGAAYKWASAFLGPVGGAIAGATAFAAVMGLEGLASAAGGFDIPTGMNPLTQLHSQEMVLPARLANPMRDMLANGGPGGGSSFGGHTINFGDFNVHGGPTGMSPGEFRQSLSDHASHVASSVAGALRSGWRPNYKQPFGVL